MNSKTLYSLLITASLIGLSSYTFAFTPGACRADAERLCPGSTDATMTPCLAKYETQLSTACRVNLAEGRAMVRELKDVCESDMKKFCANVSQGGGRIRRCLKEHEAELSNECKDRMHAAKRKLETGSSAPAQ